MAVYKNSKNGDWFIRVYINKKQIYKSGFHSKNEAKIAEQQLLLNNKNIIKKELKSNENNLDNNIVFQELYNTYIAHKRQTLKPKSYISYKSIFENHILPYFKDYRIKNISNKDYINWKDYILSKGFSYKYNSTIHICMVSILNYAMIFYDLEKNIASKVGNFYKGDYMPKVDFWTYEEFNKFINKVDDLIYYTLFNTLYFTGIRIGEALALNWNDLYEDYIDINKTISRGGKKQNYLITSPKTRSSIRKVKLDRETIKMLTTLKDFYKRIVDFSDNWYIFGGIKPLARSTIAERKAKYCKLAEVKKIRIHDFRHSHVSLLLSKGVPLTVISKRLGHKDLSTTLNKYSHLVPEDEDKAITLLNNLNMKNNFK